MFKTTQWNSIKNLCESIKARFQQGVVLLMAQVTRTPLYIKGIGAPDGSPRGLQTSASYGGRNPSTDTQKTPASPHEGRNPSAGQIIN